jgi:hypothetical protein
MDKLTHTNSHIPEVTEKTMNSTRFYISNEDNDLEKKRNTKPKLRDPPLRRASLTTTRQITYKSKRHPKTSNLQG